MDMHGHLHDLIVLLPEMKSDVPLGWEAKRALAPAGRFAEKFLPLPRLPGFSVRNVITRPIYLGSQEIPPK
jgi:hypothetical protein